MLQQGEMLVCNIRSVEIELPYIIQAVVLDEFIQIVRIEGLDVG